MDFDRAYADFKQHVDDAFAAQDSARAEHLAKAKALMMSVKPEERAAFWVKVTEGCVSTDPEQLSYVKMCHAAFAQVIMDVFGVPMGEKGAGVKPKRGMKKKIAECIMKNRSN